MVSVGCSRFSWVRPRFGRTSPPLDRPKFRYFSLARHNVLPLLGVFSLNFCGGLSSTSGPIGFFDSAFSLKDRRVPPGRLLLAHKSEEKTPRWAFSSPLPLPKKT